MENIPISLLHERVAWTAVARSLPKVDHFLRDRAKKFGEYCTSMVVTLVAHAIDANPLSIASKLNSLEFARGINERIYKLKFSSLSDFEDDMDVEDCELIYLLTKQGGRFSIKSMRNWCVEKDVRNFELCGNFHTPGFEVWTKTYGGSIYNLLHRMESWPEREKDAKNGGNLSRFLRGLKYGPITDLTTGRDPHEFFGISVMDDFTDKIRRKDEFLFRSSPENFSSLYPWMCDDDDSKKFEGFLHTINSTTKAQWAEIESTKDEVTRPSKRRKQEGVELDFSTFPLTHKKSFDLKDNKAMTTLLQDLFCDFKSQHIIQADNGEMWEKVNRNGQTFETPDYSKVVSTEKMGIDFTNHPRHLLDDSHNDSCIFCRYDFGKTLRGYPEFAPFFEKASQCMACKSGRTMFSDVTGNNGGKILDKSLVAFMNVYFDIVNLRFISVTQIENYGRIAVCNHTDKVVPESFILNESALRDDSFFDNNKRLIPVFNSCLGQTEGVTKVLLADLGSGFIPRGDHDNYQKGTFILGPGGRGKSEFQKIIRVIHGANCITPCQNTLGQKFSHGQYAGSLAVAYLPDEIHKKCGLSQQMLYNFIDQTPIRCEIKFKQQLKTLPFQLYICWVANAFFSEFELSEALLRRATVFDVNFFTFMKSPC